MSFLIPAQYRGSGAGMRRALSRRWHAVTLLMVLPELVAQRPDRDSEYRGRMSAIAQAVIERIDDEISFDVGNAATDELRCLACLRRVWS